MSSGVQGGAGRVSIPTGVKKMIQNINDITGHKHSEDEIYAMLKECNMDPNETTHKLLILDAFHEVKRKRDRRKENMFKEPAESKWKPGPQTRANRAGRGNYLSRYAPQDAGRNLAAVKENAASHLTEKGTGKAPLVNSQDVRKNETSSFASATTTASNGPFSITSQSTSVLHENHGEGTVSIGSVKKTDALGGKDILPCQDLRLLNAVDTIQLELGIQDAPTDQLEDNLIESKSVSAKIFASEVDETTALEQEVPNDFQGVGKNQNSESMQTASSAVNCPSANCNNIFQNIGPQVGSGKEWEPKSTTPCINEDGTTAGSLEVLVVFGCSHSEPQTCPVLTSKEATVELQKKLEETHISDSQHVIIPNHLHIPEVKKLGFCFGSFEASFGLDMNQNGVPGRDKSLVMSDSIEPIDGPVKELQSSNQDALLASEDTDVKYHDQPGSRSQGTENFSASEIERSPSINSDYNESKPKVTPGSHEHHVVNASNYSFAFMPPTFGAQFAPSERSESQERDAFRVPGFMVPQSFDPANNYTQFYRSGLDSDGPISAFQSAGPAIKYSGNAALVYAQTPQTSEELQGAPLITQAAGVMQSSVFTTQKHLPVFRHPAGVHLSHYPPNYIPYGPYFSPFYVPPPAIHQFLSNGVFPRLPQAGGGLYQTAPETNAKFSVSQYKQGSNMGSSSQIEVPGSYGPYGFSAPNYTSGSATTAVTSASNEDIAAPQTKGNNVYVRGEQNEGSGVWYGRDISALQAPSVYNIPQGQLGFAPSQTGHSGFYHPAHAANVHPLLQQSQAIASNPVGPTTGVYQHNPQHTQTRWPSNY